MITATESKLPKIKMALPGPKAKQVIEYDAKYISPSLSRSYPLVAERGSGAIVEDPDGNAFLDFAAGIAVCSTGHCHPKVVAAIQKQAAELIHIAGTDFYHRHMPQLAERLVATMPKSDQWKVFFGNSGTEAVEGAIKLARYATKRDKLIAFYGCFHGRTMGSLSLTASKNTQRKHFGTLLGGVEHIPYPYAYRCALGHGREECGGEIIELLEQQIFKRLFAPEEVAAIIVEPIQGEGGFIPAPLTFLQELQRICNKHGIMLILDEIQAGMGRTGKMWAYDHAGITPDIVSDRERHRERDAHQCVHREGERDAMEAGVAWDDLRGQSRLRCGCARDTGFDRGRANGECAKNGRVYFQQDQRLAEAVQDCR